MVGQSDLTAFDQIAEHLADMAAALLAPRPGLFRAGAIAYLRGAAEIWGEPNLWRELPPEVRDRMERVAGDLALPGAEEAAAEQLLAAAAMLAIDDRAAVDPSDFSLDFGRREEVA